VKNPPDEAAVFPEQPEMQKQNAEMDIKAVRWPEEI
jgi:hypothetical protein